MKKIVLINSLLFVYCLLTVNRELFQDDFAFDSSLLSQGCVKNLISPPLTTQPKLKNSHPIKLINLFFDFKYRGSSIVSNSDLIHMSFFKTSYFNTPIYQLIKTGLSPPRIS